MDIIVLDVMERAACVLSDDGDGCPYFADEHTEDLRGTLTYTFSILADHPSAAYLRGERLVLFTDLDRDMRLMRIKRVAETHGDTHTMVVYTESAHTELNEDIMRPTSWAGTAPQTILAAILAGTRYEVGQCDYPGNVYDVEWRDFGSCLAAVRALAEQTGMELRYRATFSNNAITHRYVDLLNRRGSDTNKSLEYAKDTRSITRTTDSSQLVTAMVGLGTPGATEGTFLTFAALVAADKPAAQDWVGDATALQAFGVLLPDGSRKHRFGVFRDPDETSPTRLLTKTRAALAARITSALTYDVDAALLDTLPLQDSSQSPGSYDHERVSLGDTIILRDLSFSPPLSVLIRVSEIRRSYSDPSIGSTVY